MQKRFTKLAAVVAALAALSACGDTVGEQALIGAGAGTVGAVVLDGNPVTGAVIGGAGNVLFCQQYPSRC